MTNIQKQFQAQVDIINKLPSIEGLTPDEKKIISTILNDPLQEFIKREADFRLREYFNVPDSIIEKYQIRAEEVISDVLNNNEYLYDVIDDRLDYLVDGSKYRDDD